MAEPHRHDHVQLRTGLEGANASPWCLARSQASTQADVEAAFASRARDGSMVTNVGSRLGDVPEVDTARQLSEVFDPEQIMQKPVGPFEPADYCRGSVRTVGKTWRGAHPS